MKNILLTITGPSLSGKSTLERMIHTKYKTERLISFTTRPRREGEVDGVDYYFLSKTKAMEAIEQGETAEHVYFSSNYYGLLGTELKSKLTKSSCIAVVEPNGARQLRQYCAENDLNHKAIFLTNPPEVLAARFLKRFRDNTEASPIDYAQRMVGMIRDEQSWIHVFDYDAIYARFDSSNEYYLVEDIYTNFLQRE